MHVYVTIYGCLWFHIQKYWSCNLHERKLFSFVDNGRLAGKIRHVFKAPLSPQERDDQRWLSSYFFIRNGDGSSAFPESVKDRRAQRFIHHRSQLHRLFILLGRPTSEARPIKFSHSCPKPVIWLTSTETLFHSRCFFLSIPDVPFILISQFLPLCPSPPVTPSLFSLLMRSELVLKIMTWSWGQSCR